MHTNKRTEIKNADQCGQNQINSYKNIEKRVTSYVENPTMQNKQTGFRPSTLNDFRVGNGTTTRINYYYNEIEKSAINHFNTDSRFTITE